MGVWKRLALVAALALLLPACTNPPRSPGRAWAAASNPTRASAAFVGRYRTAVIPPLGMIYSDVKAPAFAKAAGATLGTRSGEASVHSIGLPPIPGIMPAIDLFTWGDASTEKAAQDGGITDVTHVDYEGTVVLMIYRRLKIITYGN